MSKVPKRHVLRENDHARIFAALGDSTRLELVRKLSGGEPSSIVELARDSGLTRQGITKHLRVLQKAEIVHSIRVGRETLFEFTPHSLGEIQEYLEIIASQVDTGLASLKNFVEKT